ncbi:MAG: hypothetical protein ACLFSB_10735 [Chitinispirillaceae bacterium]
MKSEKNGTTEATKHRLPGMFIPAIAVILVLVGGEIVLNGAKSSNLQAAPADTTTKVYRAELNSLNDSIAGMSATGTATIALRGDSMFIEVVASGLQPQMMHLQHYHGFPDGEDASCATEQQDVNRDGIVDLIETRSVSGVTLVPFNDNPAELELTAESYPQAGEQGTFTYNDTVLISELLSSLTQRHNIDSLQLENRVIYLHGVSEDTQLPESVESLEGVPAHVTLPVACGKLQEVDKSWLPF